MALTFPRTDIVTAGQFEQQSFSLITRQELSRIADGRIYGKDLGPEVWVVEYTSIPMSTADAVTFEAKLRSLRGVLNAFEAYDLRRPYPLAHADGAFNDTGTLLSIGVDNLSLALQGLPAGLALSVGDYLSFEDDDEALALHQVMEDVTANGSGVTTEFAVVPEIRDVLVSPPKAVVLKRPPARFKLLPNSITTSKASGGIYTVSFRGVQHFA